MATSWIEYRATAKYSDGSWMTGRPLADLVEAAFQAGLWAAEFAARGGGKVVIESRSDYGEWIPVKTVEV